MWTKATHFVACAFMAASLAFVAGCNGGSSGGGGGGSDALPVGGNNVVGPADPVQDALLDLGSGLGGTPVLGGSTEALVAALVSLLDVPDGLAGAFQEFMLSQDPQDLLRGGELSGDALLSFAAGLNEVVIQLTEEGAAVPGLDQLTPMLLELERLVQEGITGETGGGDLTVLTDMLVSIANILYGASQQVPAEVENAPLVGDLLATLAQGTLDLSDILDAVGRLDGDDTSAALVGAFQNLLTGLSGSLPGGAGAQLEGAVTEATVLFQNGLALLLEPLFQALRGVLAPVTGSESPFAPLLTSLISLDLEALGGVGGFGDLLAGGGTASDGSSIPLLGDLLAGLPLLGDLLGGLLGGDAGGGLPLLGDVLESGGTGGLPLLGDLLQGLPGLSAPGGTGELPLPLLGDLLTTLLALDGGVPVIGDILAAGGDGSGGLDLPVIGGLLDDLLGTLLGLSGGVDSSGGFLDGLGGIPVLGPLLGGLLDTLLGGLLG